MFVHTSVRAAGHTLFKQNGWALTHCAQIQPDVYVESSANKEITQKPKTNINYAMRLVVVVGDVFSLYIDVENSET